MNLDHNHSKLLNYINLVKVFFSLINIAYAHATRTHSFQYFLEKPILPSVFARVFSLKITKLELSMHVKRDNNSLVV